jgi:hypothetical protein
MTPIGAVHAAVAGFWLQHRVTLLAFIEPLACIRRHCFGLHKAALRACQRGFQRDVAHNELPTKIDGEPILMLLVTSFETVGGVRSLRNKWARIGRTKFAPSAVM